MHVNSWGVIGWKQRSLGAAEAVSDVQLRASMRANLSFKLLWGRLRRRCLERARVGSGVPDRKPRLGQQAVGKVGDLTPAIC